MNVRETMTTLTNEQRHAIMLSFDKCEAGIVELGEGKFIGVHLDENALSGLNVEDALGAWCVGTLKGEK